jgi:hypothetical protein
MSIVNVNETLDWVDTWLTTTENEKTPIRWLSPECMRKQLFSIKSDVFSYVILCWKIFANRCQPYPDIAIQDLSTSIVNRYQMTFPKKHHRVSFASRPHAELTLLICYWRWAMWSANWQASNTSNRCTNSDTITWTVHRRHWLSLDMCLFCYYLSNKLCLIGHLFSKKSRVDWPVIDAKKFTMNRSLTIKFDLENCINFFVEIQCKFANAWYKFCGLSKFT